MPTDPPCDQHANCHCGNNDGSGTSRSACHFVVQVPGKVSECHEQAPPQHAAGDVPQREAPVGHAAQAGQCRHHGAEEGGEPAKEDGRAAPPLQELLGFLQLGALPVIGLERHQPGAQVLADFIPHRVAQDRGGDHHGNHHRERDAALAGDHTSHHRRGFAGNDKADEEGVLGENEREHNTGHQYRAGVEESVEECLHQQQSGSRDGLPSALHVPASPMLGPWTPRSSWAVSRFSP
ncbi:hypothetical protein D9M72_282970 [compost metagenome]